MRSRLLVKLPEHTWGMYNFLTNDYNYSNAQFNAERSGPNFVNIEATWAEQRSFADRYVKRA